MRVLVSGASGLVGTAVVNALRARDDEVGALVRHGESSGLDVAWDPATGTLDRTALARGGFDAVVHLAGESIMGRWNDAKRRRIRESRVDGTALLAEALAELDPDQRPRVLVCASATGYYGDRGEELLTEQASRGEGFLAEVVGAWEQAANPARDAGIRTVHVRQGPVYSPRGGALKPQLLPFKLGLGGPIGNGRNWAAWIGLHEAARVFLFAIDEEQVVGAINAVGPTPSRNREQARALGRVLHRPTILPTPVPVLRLAMGEVVQELTGSQKVVPGRLEALGFEFSDRTFEDALRRELDRAR